jgi:ferric-dicitrate binding protein FerR (iron transport regulator)
MSREERRAYQRQMKSMEKGPALPPAARARAERNAAKRAARRPSTEPAPPFSRRFVLRAVLIAVAIGFLAFSLQWDNGNGMPRAAYIGLAVGAVALGVSLGVRWFLSRAAPRAP